MTHPSRKQRRKLHSLYVWHRIIGLCAALFVVILALTGIALNHSDALQLSQRHVQSSALLNWYGIQPPQEFVSYASAGHYVTRVGDRLYFDASALPADGANLVGIVRLPQGFAVATTNGIRLLTDDGRLIERLGAVEGVPRGIARIGTTADGAIAVQTAHEILIGDESLTSWQARPGVEILWSQPSAPPAALRSRLLRSFRGDGLPLERVLLDIHSGRILGHWGVYVMDGAALLLLFLAASGCWLWLRNRMKQRSHRRLRRSS